MRDADLEVARLTSQVGVLEAQLAAAKAARDAALERHARLGRIYGATRGLRTATIRQLEAHLVGADGQDAVRVVAAVAFLRRASMVDAEWDASARPSGSVGSAP